nr:FtsX-like permease family protein [uncultured Bacteroides sp.]
MNKKLLKQIWNERRINVWLWVELLLVSVVLWYVVDTSYTTLSTYFEPRGFDISNTYLINIDALTAKSPDYIDPSTRTIKPGEDLLQIVERLRHLPDVEAVSVSINSYPYNGSNSGFSARLDTMRVWGICREVTPDFLRVFRYEGANGESPDQLAALLNENNFIAGENLLTRDYGLKGKDILGRSFYLNDDTIKTWPLVAVTHPVRYGDFRSTYESRYIIILFDQNTIADFNEVRVRQCEVCLRTHDNSAPGFIDRLRAISNSQFRVGNLFLGDIQSMQNIRTMFQMDDMNELRNQAWGIGFLLLNIFLGLLGTFWFRTQQRRSEIALHISCGSTHKQAFIRLMGEGLLLLVLATIIALIIDFNLAYAEYTNSMNGTTLAPVRFVVTSFITFLLMALMIVIGIWFPARQAMKIQPAEALREE